MPSDARSKETTDARVRRVEPRCSNDLLATCRSIAGDQYAECRVEDLLGLNDRDVPEIGGFDRKRIPRPIR